MKKRSIGKYIFLSIITLGIYSIVFWYKWTEDVNTLCADDDDDSANYLLVVILSLFTCGIYTFVWNYKMVERLYQKAPDYGVQLKHGGFYAMIWRLFLPIVSSVYKISSINKLVDAYNANAVADTVEE